MKTAPTFRFGLRSTSKLLGVHPDLIKIATRAIQLSSIDFAITHGVRTVAEQLELFKAGKSQTQRSRHLTGHAVDVAAIKDGKVTWDWSAYVLIATAFKSAASELGLHIEWGGDWQSFKDGVHFQLPRSLYPAEVPLPNPIDASSE